MEFTIKSGKIYDSENNLLCDVIGEFTISDELKENAEKKFANNSNLYFREC